MKFLSVCFVVLLASLPFGTAAWGKPLPPEKERKLLELEAQVYALERKAFELKQKIRVISDKIFKKKFDTGKPIAVLYHSSKMASYFLITKVTYTLVQNGTNRVLQTKSTTIPNKLPLQWQIFKGTLPPGRYTLKVKAKVRGYNPVLTYINNYRLTLQNQIPFRMRQGKRTVIRTEFADRGGTNVGGRLYILFRMTK